jgi:hypothetical protein
MTDAPETVWIVEPERVRGTAFTYTTAMPENRVTYVREDTVKAQIDAAVAAERKRVKPFLDTSQRFHRRMQLLEGYWAGKLARTRSELGFWKSAFSRQHKPDENFGLYQTEAFERGINAACDAMQEDKSLHSYYGTLIEKVRVEAIRKGKQP